MTTAVASPPNLQSLPRLGWNGGSTGGGFSAMSTEDVSRIFMPQRKIMQRSNSSSSLASTASSDSTSSTSTATDASSTANGDGPIAATKKKSRGGFWPVSKAESTSGVSAARANGSVQPTSVLSGKAPIQPALPSQSGPQTNGARSANGAAPQDAAAILALLPMNGTFERKQISVPFYPENMRVGRQTNAKTVPTPTNGYFDSKVLSRQHAEVWADRNGKVWIRDVKSSNGTFVNGQRLSQENRESGPHELRQHDTLELGIDIVSEDQKTIVHHKVSAKVEYVGLPGASNNVLDLSFGDLDPSHGSSLLPSPLSSPMMHQRSRSGGPAVPNRSASSSVAAAQMSAAAQNRQINLWGPPLSVEHLVKQISHEMRAAKQQATELDHIEKTFNQLLSPSNSPQQESEAVAVSDESKIRPASTKSRSTRAGSIARFGEPPAPPPQQPLPEKPDSARPSSLSSLSLTGLLKRTETAKPGSAGTSPSRTEPASVMEYVAALDMVKKELDSHKSRVKELEDLLREEKTARVEAEERARKVEQTGSHRPISVIEEVHDEEETSQPAASSRSKVADTTENNQGEASDELALQKRLDQVIAEMQKMKTDMDKYRKRAEMAEVDATKARESLAEMIERLRQENDAEDVDFTANATEKVKAQKSHHAERAVTESESGGLSKDAHAANGHIRTPRLPTHLQQAVATAIRQSSDGNPEALAQSAPYVSMLGVVLIGVGLMAYLNSWQKRDQ